MDCSAVKHKRLLYALAGRARRMGARDPEAIAQEALIRALESPDARAAVEFYFGETAPESNPEFLWELDRLLGWLHIVVMHVTREEFGRARYRREVLVHFGPSPESSERGETEPPDLSVDVLESLLRKEESSIVDECLARLEPEYRQVLEMRREGFAYDEISNQLDLKPNTVATRVRRGVEKLTSLVRKRLERYRTNGGA